MIATPLASRILVACAGMPAKVAKDMKAGDRTGDGFDGNIRHVARL